MLCMVINVFSICLFIVVFLFFLNTITRGDFFCNIFIIFLNTITRVVNYSRIIHYFPNTVRCVANNASNANNTPFDGLVMGWIYFDGF